MPGFKHPVSAGVAKRLAAAADGFRHGRPMYFVSGYRDVGPIQRYEGEEGREAAERARREREARGEEVDVFGPYVTGAGGEPGARAGHEVLDVTVRVRLTDGSVRTRVLDGGDYDAIFWTRSAVDKFVIPYYAGAVGLPQAVRISEDFAGDGVYMLGHLPDTVSVMIRAEEGEAEGA